MALSPAVPKAWGKPAFAKKPPGGSVLTAVHCTVYTQNVSNTNQKMDGIHDKAENGFVPTKKPEKIPNKAFVTDHILLVRNKV